MDSTLIELQNPWWQNGWRMTEDTHLKAVCGLPYYYAQPLLSTLSLKPALLHIIRGPRQVGKTTLIKELIGRLIKESVDASTILFLSCEGFTSFTQLQDSLAIWLKGRQGGTSFVFLDEISFIPEWQRAILWLGNVGLLGNTCLTITGSNARDLKQSSERFPGRRGGGRDISLYPLLPHEYEKLACFSGTSRHELMAIYDKVGGFPHAIRDFVTTGEVADETYRTYRNWIIGDASRYKLSEEFLRHVVYRICETFGTRITWSSLIENSTIRSHETALQYIEHLEDAFLCRVHHSFDPQVNGPAPAKARKLYFIDPLLYYLGFAWMNNITNIFQWAATKQAEPKFRGHLVESMFVNSAARKFPSVYFWYSTRDKKEVDLVVPIKGDVRLFEIKCSPEKSYRALNQDVTILTPGDFFEFAGGD